MVLVSLSDRHRLRLVGATRKQRSLFSDRGGCHRRHSGSIHTELNAHDGCCGQETAGDRSIDPPDRSYRPAARPGAVVPLREAATRVLSIHRL
jgi:hypothetical protein